MHLGTRVPSATSASTHTHAGVDAHAHAWAVAHTHAYALPAPYIGLHPFLPPHFLSISAALSFLSPRGPSPPKHESSSNSSSFTTKFEVQVAGSDLLAVPKAMRRNSMQIHAGSGMHGATRGGFVQHPITRIC